MIIGQQADLAAVDADRLLADARPERHAPALAGVRRPWAERLPAARLLGHHVEVRYLDLAVGLDSFGLDPRPSWAC